MIVDTERPIPAAVQHMRAMMHKPTGIWGTLEWIGDNEISMRIIRRDVDVTFYFASHKHQWYVADIRLIKDGVEKDAKGDLMEVLKALSEKPGVAGDSKAAGPSAGSRNGGAEYHRNTVIRV